MDNEGNLAPGAPTSSKNLRDAAFYAVRYRVPLNSVSKVFEVPEGELRKQVIGEIIRQDALIQTYVKNERSWMDAIRRFIHEDQGQTSQNAIVPADISLSPEAGAGVFAEFLEGAGVGAGQDPENVAELNVEN